MISKDGTSASQVNGYSVKGHKLDFYFFYASRFINVCRRTIEGKRIFILI